MRKRLAASAAHWLGVALAFKRGVLLAVALTTAAAVVGAPADIARGLAWLQAQVRADGGLAAGSTATAPVQAQCEAASTLLKLAGNSPELASLVSALQSSADGSATETLACLQALRQAQGQTVSHADLDGRRVPGQGYAAYQEFGMSNALDTGRALAARLASLGAQDRDSVLVWLQASQGTAGSFAIAGRPDLVATAAVLRGLNDTASSNAVAAAIATKAAAWLLAQRQPQGQWAGDVGVTSLVYEAVHPYSAVETTLASAVEGFLLAAQRADGSWAGDAWVTAVALRALSLTGVEPIDPTLAAAATIRGAVTLAAGGEPAAGAAVTAMTGGATQKTIITDAQGRYVLRGIAPGTIGLSASLPGHQTAATQVSVQAGGTAIFSPALTATGADVPAIARIVGVVAAFGSNTPLAGVSVQAVGTTQLATSTQVQGSFELTVPPGGYTISYSLGGYLAQTLQVVVTGGSVADLGTVLLRPERTTSNLRGVVTDLNGAPVSGATVGIQGGPSTSSSTAGAFSLSGLSGLQFNLQVSAPGFASRAVSLSTPVPADLVQNVALAGLTQGYLSLADLSLSAASAGLRTDVTATATVTNPSPAEAAAVGSAQVLDPQGKVVATLGAQDGSGSPASTLVLPPGGQKTIRFRWNTGSFEPGRYTLVARLHSADAVPQGTPDSTSHGTTYGVVLASQQRDLAITGVASFLGSVSATPPVTRAGIGTVVKLSALIQNDGNVVLPAQDYKLSVVNTVTGLTTLTRIVSGDALPVRQLRTMNFEDWTPQGGGNFRVELAALSTPGALITSTLFVGDAAGGNFAVDKPVVPAGSQLVRATIDVKGQDVTVGTISDPLAPLVKTAVTKAVNFADGYMIRDYGANFNCFACHVQTQALVGGERNRRFVTPLSEAQRHNFVNSITQSVGRSGEINHENWTIVVPTMLGLWASGEWKDRNSIISSRRMLAEYMLSRQRTDNGAWDHDFDAAWWRSRAPMTAVTMEAMSRLKADVQAGNVPLKTRLVPFRPAGLPVTGYMRMQSAPDGTLYVTHSNGVYKVPPGGPATLLVAARSDLTMISAYPIADGRVVIGAAQGVYLRGSDGTLTKISSFRAHDAQPFGPGRYLVSEYPVDPYAGTARYVKILEENGTENGTLTNWISDSSLNYALPPVVMPDGDVLVGGHLSKNVLRFKSDGTRRDIPIPYAPWVRADLPGKVQNVIRFGDGVVVTGEGGVTFYDRNWIAERWAHDFANGAVGMPDGRLLVSMADGLYEVRREPIDAANFTQRLENSIGSAANYLRSTATAPADNSNVEMAFRLYGLARARDHFKGTPRANEFDAGILSLGALLRSRQRADGGWLWKENHNFTVSDPMVTAQVSLALDALNPSVSAPEVRKSIEYLLGAQQSDDSWRSLHTNPTWPKSGIASTPLIPSTWVEIWLPTLFDRLGGMDTDLSVTFAPNVVPSNPSRTPTQVVTAADGSKTYVWKLASVTSSGAQVSLDLTLLDMQVDETRPVARDAGLVFRNSFVDGSVTLAIGVPNVAVRTNLSETVVTDKPAYTEADQAVFSATASNAGAAARDAQVRFTVLDASGAVVEVLPLGPTVSVPGAGSASIAGLWPVSGIPSGNYQVKADLYSPAGLLYGSATANFVVTASQLQATSARINADRLSYNAAQNVQLTSRVANHTANTVLDNLQAKTEVRSAAGQGVFSRTEPISQLAAGGSRQYAYSLGAGGLAAGSYVASLQLLGSTGSALSQSTTSFTVVGTDQSGVGLAGALQASPASALIGQPVALNLGATNNGNAGLGNIPVAVRVVDPASGAVLAKFTQTVASWPQGATQNFAWSWTALGLDGQTVVAVASANVAGREVSLGQANVRLVGVPRLNAEPAQLTFPVIYVGEVLASQAAVVTSVGSTTATSVTLSLSGADASQFVIPDGGCTQQSSLPMGATCTFTVSYQPTQVAQHNAELKVSYAGGTDIVIPLTGQAKPVILGGTVAPEAPQVTLGQSIGLSYTLSNPASASTTASVSLSVVDGGGQVERTWPIPASLAPTGTLSGTQSFAATGIPRTLTVILSQSVDGTTTVLAQGSFEVIGIPKLTAQPLQLGFPCIYVGETAPLQTVTVTSAGSITATSVTLSLAGASPSQFVIPPGECTQNSSLGIGATCTFAVSYRPSEAGTHSAQARIGYTNGTDVVIMLGGQAKPVILGGSVMPEPRQVAVGETTSLGYSLSNPANVSVTASVSLSLLDTSGSLVATWPIAASIAGSATSAGNQSYTPAINPQPLQVVLSQSVGGNSVVLATSTLVVTEIPVKVDPVANIRPEARILVLVSCPLGSSANDGPPPDDAACVQQRSLGISAYLTSLGIAHKVVSTEQDFKRELCCGLYNTYWISGGAAKLRPEIVGQLRETIWAGESLITDGVHDSRNALLHPVNGILHGGKLPVADQPIAILDGSIYTPGSLPTLGQPFKPELLPGAKAQAWFTQVPGNQAPVPAVVSNRYGSGGSLLFAFDMAGMVTADPQAGNAPLRDVMVVTASQSANGTQTLTVGDLTALALSVSNQGTRTTSVEVRASLPAGVLHHSASIEPASVPQPGTNGGTVTWTISLGALQNRELIWRVLANEAGVHELPVAFYSVPRVPGETVRLLDTRSFTLRVESAARLVQDALFAVLALQPGASGDKSNKAKALDAVQQATSLHNQGRYQDAITQWLAASDALIAIASADTTAARDAVAKALEASTDALCRVAQ